MRCSGMISINQGSTHGARPPARPSPLDDVQRSASPTTGRDTRAILGDAVQPREVAPLVPTGCEVLHEDGEHDLRLFAGMVEASDVAKLVQDKGLKKCLSTPWRPPTAGGVAQDDGGEDCVSRPIGALCKAENRAVRLHPFDVVRVCPAHDKRGKPQFPGHVEAVGKVKIAVDSGSESGGSDFALGHASSS